MSVQQLTSATFDGGIEPLAPPLDDLANKSLQLGERVLLQTNTSRDEAIIITAARIIIFKGPSKRSSPNKAGRFFPLDTLQDVNVRRGIFGGHIVIITPNTANEYRPFDMAQCSFAVTFRNRQRLDAVSAYLMGILANFQSMRAQHIASGPLHPVNVPGVVPMRGETFYYGTQATIYAKHTYTTYQGGSQGISFRIMPGVYYRVGGTRGRSTPQSTVEPDDHGILAISNLRLIFMGATQTVDIPFRQIVGVTAFTGGVRISLSNGKTLQFLTGDILTEPMLQRLCTNPP